MTRLRYFTVTTSVSDQKMSERIPSTAAGIGVRGPVRVQTFAQRIEGAGPDVAEDDAERSEREHGARRVGSWPMHGAQHTYLGRTPGVRP